MSQSSPHIIPTQQLAELANHVETVLPPQYLPRTLHMSQDMVAGADVFVSSRSVVNLPSPAEPNVMPHTHSVSQTYLFLSPDDSLEVQVAIDGKTFTTRAPSSAFIPKDTLHSLQILRGTGTVISIVRSGEYL